MSGSMRRALAEVRSIGAPLLLLVALVSLAASVAVAAPQAMTRATSLELAAELSSLTEAQGNITGGTNVFAVTGPSSLFDGPLASVDTAFGPLLDALDERREAAPEPLRSALGTPVVVVGNSVQVLPAEPRDDDPRFLISGIAAPAWEDRIAVVDGRLPQPWDLRDTPEPSGDTINGEPVDVFEPPAIEIVLTPQGAEALRWTLGEERVESDSRIPFVLVGRVDPVDAENAYWQLIPAAPESERFDDGNQQPRETAAAFVHPLTVSAPGTFGSVAVQYPLDTGSFDATTVNEALPQLRSFITSELRVPYSNVFGSGSATVTLGSEVPAAANAVLNRVGVTQAILALTVAGPLGRVR